jgi:biotin carboxyl carrier protein
MQNFRVNVNGRIYEVGVEELVPGMNPAPLAASVESPSVTEASVPVVSVPAGPTNVTLEPADKPVNAPLSGSIIQIKVKPGEKVKYGQVLLTLEALKMENEIVAPEAGTVKAIFVQVGSSVNVGDVLLSLVP